MRVDEFAFGFGPRIVRLFKRGDTEYTIRAFPLGGFVKIAGMEPGEENIADGFQAQAIWKRALVIFCGPLASFLLAIFVFLALGIFWGYQVGRTTNEIGMVSPKTEAARAGLQSGDHILEINGIKITDGKQMIDMIHSMPGKPITLIAERHGQKIVIKATPKWRITYLDGVWSFMNGNHAVLQYFAENSPAKKAGMEPKDVLVSINGKHINSGADMVAAINAGDGKPVHIIVERGGKSFTVKTNPCIQIVSVGGIRWIFPESSADVSRSMLPIKSEDMLISVDEEEIESGASLVSILRKSKTSSHSLLVYRDDNKKRITLNITPSEIANMKTEIYYAYGVLGFAPTPALVKTGISESLSRGMRLSFGFVRQLIGTLTSPRIKEEIGGPLMIAKITHSSVARGPYEVFLLLGGLSMSLAFINLLPIPIVDGGHLVLLAVEAIRRKRLTAEQMQVFQMIGLFILAGIFILVMWSDVSKITHGLVPQ